MIKRLLLLAFLILASESYAQQGALIGKVKDVLTNRPIKNALITVRKKSHNIYHTESDSAGQFIILKSVYSEGDHLSVKAAGYDSLSVSGRKMQALSFAAIELVPTANLLREVTVKARKRYSDTSHINFADKKFERSFMTSDLLSQSGIYKDANGQLYYKGKHVSALKVNGNDFFGRSNLDVYSMLPALTISDIEIVETDIDDESNVTLSKPTVKLNLRLKPKYNSGKFGNVSLGGGTVKRYIGAADLYAYKGKSQFSIAASSNNINVGDDPPLEPTISFPALSNQITVGNLKLTYSDLFFDKLKINVTTKGKLGYSDYSVFATRRDNNINQLSQTVNGTTSKSLTLPDADAQIQYQIDSLRNISASLVNSYDKTRTNNYLKYNITADSVNTVSDLTKLRNLTTENSSAEINYMQRFAKKGRVLHVNANYSKTIINNDENDYFEDLLPLSDSYFIDGKRKSNSAQWILGANFTEPINDVSFINLYLSLKRQTTHYAADINSDTATIYKNDHIDLSISNITSGLKYQKTFSKTALDVDASGLFYFRNEAGYLNGSHLFAYGNANIKIDHTINSERNLILNYQSTTDFPTLSQLLDINSTFDLISQTTSNVNLKPQTDNMLDITYNFKNAGGASIRLNAQANYYNQKIGFRTTAVPGLSQIMLLDNLGNAFSTSASASISKNIGPNFTLNTYSAVTYGNDPTVFNNIFQPNDNLSFTQSISTSKELIKGVLTISPFVSATYRKYKYGTTGSETVNLIYNDRFTTTLFKFKVELIPLVNYSHSLTDLTSASMNAEIKRPVFNDMGTVWLQGYDLFNSFKFDNTYVGPVYTQTVNFTNVRRYFIVGISMKLNNMK